MDFTLPEVTQDLRGLARDITEKVSTDERVARLEADDAALDDVLWRELGAAGLLGLEVGPEVAGDAGAGQSILESITVAEQLGRGLARVPYGLHAVAALPAIATHGSAALREHLAGEAATGAAVLTVALEEDLGTNSDHPQTLLSRTEHGWALTGSKVNVGYAGAATAIVVNAMSPDGVRAVVVDADAAGVRRTPTPATGKTPSFIVDFDGVVVDDDHVLDGGAVTVADIVDRATLAVCADQAGTLSRALELTAAYAVEREQFGKPIGAFQAVAQRLADGYIDTQGLSLTTLAAAWQFTRITDAGEDNDDGGLHVAVQTAKFWACDAGHRVAHTAVHVHGGVGLDTTHPVHRYFLRAKQNEYTLGSAPVTLAAIGDALAAAPA
ncbi:acyl-CoA dehydrogenase family protein [Gordonia polyisoprenivorans]|uniref:acyl-CoA dehydrogenase family protein n=1 Tax=Gordonia polyisoprenivorans TaxID=84595 RepID=UPI0030CCD991